MQVSHRTERGGHFVYRLSLILMAIMVAAITHGCEDKRVPELQARIDQLEGQLRKVNRRLRDAESEIVAVESAVDDVNSAVDELESEDSINDISVNNINVMVARAAADLLDGTVTQLKSTIEDALMAAN